MRRLFDSAVINEMVINIYITYKNGTFQYFVALAMDLSLFINNSGEVFPEGLSRFILSC